MRLHVVPRSSRTAISGLHGDALKLKVQAPPVEGAANREIQAFLSRALKISKGRVRLVSGAGSRQKEFFIEGGSMEDLRSLLRKGG